MMPGTGTFNAPGSIYSESENSPSMRTPTRGRGRSPPSTGINTREIDFSPAKTAAPPQPIFQEDSQPEGPKFQDADTHQLEREVHLARERTRSMESEAALMESEADDYEDMLEREREAARKRVLELDRMIEQERLREESTAEREEEENRQRRAPVTSSELLELQRQREREAEVRKEIEQEMIMLPPTAMLAGAAVPPQSKSLGPSLPRLDSFQSGSRTRECSFDGGSMAGASMQQRQRMLSSDGDMQSIIGSQRSMWSSPRNGFRGPSAGSIGTCTFPGPMGTMMMPQQMPQQMLPPGSMQMMPQQMPQQMAVSSPSHNMYRGMMPPGSQLMYASAPQLPTGMPSPAYNRQGQGQQRPKPSQKAVPNDEEVGGSGSWFGSFWGARDDE